MMNSQDIRQTETPPLRTRAVVVTAFPDATRAGIRALELGGNAVDAACAAAWALGVCEPSESGLGGQTTMLIRLADGRDVVLDGHSHAPRSLRRRTVKRRHQLRGRTATTIPSTPLALWRAQQLFGVLPLQTALAPAIEIAERGYAITSLQRRLLKWTRSVLQASGAGKLFLRADGSEYRVGEVFRQPLLARTLRRLSDAGVDDFYKGQLAASIVADMRSNGGLISARDLSELSLPIQRVPMSIMYSGHTILSVPPPGGGTQVLLALAVLDRLRDLWHDEASWHLGVAKATLAAMQERERWPDHPDDVTPSLARWLVSAERAESVAARVRSGMPFPTPRDSMGEAGNTTHLCTCDAAGNIVSLTQSIQSVFGAKVAHPELGFLYNNYLSTCPRSPHPYRLGGGSLPQSNAAPTIVLNSAGRPVLALGSAGSRRIASSVVSVISGGLDRGQDEQQAVGAPRVHARLSGRVWLEEGMADARTLGMFERCFRSVEVLPSRSYKLGAVQAIAWSPDGAPTAAADPRRDGTSAAT